MRGLGPRIHVFAAEQDVDGRDKHGHDAENASIRAEHALGILVLLIASLSPSAWQGVNRQGSSRRARQKIQARAGYDPLDFGATAGDLAVQSGLPKKSRTEFEDR